MAKTQGLRVTIMKFSISKKKNRKSHKTTIIESIGQKADGSNIQNVNIDFVCRNLWLIGLLTLFFDSINEPNINKMITNEKHRHKHDNRRTNAVYGTRFIYAQT